MKKHIFEAIGMIVILLTVIACEKDIDSWSGKDSIYFGVRIKSGTRSWSKELYDTTRCSFAFAPIEQRDTLIQIRLDVQGKNSPMDRVVSWEVMKGSTAVENEDYVIEQECVVVPMDSTHTFIPVRLKRTDILRSERRMIILRLLPNEYFSLNRIYYEYPDSDRRTSVLTHCIVFDDVITNWPQWGEGIMRGQLGTFSRAKMDFICEIIEIEPIYFMNREYMSLGRLVYIAKRVQRELDARKAKGEPVMDGDHEMTLKY